MNAGAIFERPLSRYSRYLDPRFGYGVSNRSFEYPDPDPSYNMQIRVLDIQSIWDPNLTIPALFCVIIKQKYNCGYSVWKWAVTPKRKIVFLNVTNIYLNPSPYELKSIRIDSSKQFENISIIKKYFYLNINYADFRLCVGTFFCKYSLVSLETFI